MHIRSVDIRNLYVFPCMPPDTGGLGNVRGRDKPDPGGLGNVSGRDTIRMYHMYIYTLKTTWVGSRAFDAMVFKSAL